MTVETAPTKRPSSPAVWQSLRRITELNLVFGASTILGFIIAVAPSMNSESTYSDARSTSSYLVRALPIALAILVLGLLNLYVVQQRRRNHASPSWRRAAWSCAPGILLVSILSFQLMSTSAADRTGTVNLATPILQIALVAISTAQIVVLGLSSHSQRERAILITLAVLMPVILLVILLTAVTSLSA